MDSEDFFILKKINDLTWHCYGDYGPEKTNLEELAEITGMGKITINHILRKLKDKKLISNATKFQGSKPGWFIRTRGNAVISYLNFREEKHK